MGSDLRGRCERRVSGDKRAEKRCRPAQQRSVKRLAQKQSGIRREGKAACARGVRADLLRATERRSDGFNTREKAADVHGCCLQLASTAELGCGISAARISAVSLATVES